MTDSKPCLTVVMPCYNEAPTVETAVRRVLESPYTQEVIVVDDGSTDGTAEILRSIDDPRLRVIDHHTNLGKGAALRRGFTEVSAPFVIVQDADLEYDPADYATMLAPLLDGQADAVFGSRFTSSPHRVLYYWHSVANRVLTLASNAVTDLNLTDVATGAKAFRRDAIQSVVLDQDRFGFDFEVTAKGAREGWRIFEVGVSYAGRTYAEGKKLRWYDGVKSLYCVARYSRTGSRLARPRLSASDRLGAVGFQDADAELEGTLDDLDEADNYADWIIEMMAPHVGGKIVELGAGHGTMSERLTRLGEVTATEPSKRAAALLRDRFADNPRVNVVEGYADSVLTEGSADAVVMINVLEHIPDDLGALRHIHDGLRADGTIAIFVPAHEALYSRFDHRIGHQRRYRRSTLSQVITRAGFEIIEIRYVNLPGVVAWFVVARLLGREPTSGALARLFDTVTVPVLRRVESRIRIPIGLSLLAIARRPPDHQSGRDEAP